MLDFLAEERRDLRDPEEHPSPETLTAYQANELSPEEDERIQGHLRVCKHCTQMLLDFEELFLRPAEAEAEPAADFEAAADWRKLRERTPPGAGEKRQTPARGREDRLLRSLRVFEALAAVLGALAIGLFLRDTYVQGRARVLPERSISFGTTRSVPEEPKPTQVHPPVVLRISPDADYPKYRVEIETASGQPKQTLEIAPDLDGGLIEIPGGWSPGTYKIRVLGLKDGRAEPVGRSKELVVVR